MACSRAGQSGSPVDGVSASDPNGTDDKGWYIPGALRSGVSVAPANLPQRVHVVAAYVDGLGRIVAPPVTGLATLAFSNVSAFKEIAMNASKKGRGDDAPDFEAVTTSVTFSSTDHTARFDLDAWDYGGIGTATVTHGTGATQASAQLRLPIDTTNGGNGLPAAGWLSSQSLSLLQHRRDLLDGKALLLHGTFSWPIAPIVPQNSPSL